MTIGTLYFSLARPTPVEPIAVETAAAETENSGTKEFRTDYLTVALLADGNVSGYLAARATGSHSTGIDEEHLNPLLLDAFHRVVYTGDLVDPNAPLGADFKTIAADVENLINGHAGEQLVEKLKLMDIRYVTHQ